MVLPAGNGAQSADVPQVQVFVSIWALLHNMRASMALLVALATTYVLM